MTGERRKDIREVRKQRVRGVEFGVLFGGSVKSLYRKLTGALVLGFQNPFSPLDPGKSLGIAIAVSDLAATT